MNTTVLIPSTDSFRDVWEPALACIAKNWPDCPYPVRTVTETGQFGEHCIKTGDDLGWSGNLVHAIDQLNCDFVLMFLDDMLVESVDQASVSRAEAWMTNHPEAGAIQVGPSAVVYETDRIETWRAKIKKQSLYRVTTGPCIWRREFLREIASQTDSPWEFEINGSRLSSTMDKEIHLSLDRPLKVHYTAITRGHVERGAKRFLDSQGIPHHFQRPETGT